MRGTGSGQGAQRSPVSGVEAEELGGPEIEGSTDIGSVSGKGGERAVTGRGRGPGEGADGAGIESCEPATGRIGGEPCKGVDPGGVEPRGERLGGDGVRSDSEVAAVERDEARRKAHRGEMPGEIRPDHSMWR